MTNDAKDLLMQYLFRIADHYEVNELVPLSFKKRGDLLDRLKEKDKEAYTVMTELIDAFIREDRIQNDREKFDKARVLWESEHAAAEKDKVNAEMLLVQFCKEKRIPIGKVGQAQ